MGHIYYTGENETVDVIISRKLENREPELLLVRRKPDKVEGEKLAFPGGFINCNAKMGEPFVRDEDIFVAAAREVSEETALDFDWVKKNIEYVGFFRGPGRDPRDSDVSWTSTHAFAFHLEGTEAEKTLDMHVLGQDDVDFAGWIAFSEVAKIQLAFDHDKILDKVHKIEKLSLPSVNTANIDKLII